MKDNNKFQFDTEFQLEILRFLIRDPRGQEFISNLKPSYLTLIEHSVILEALIKYHRNNNGRIPSKVTLNQVIKDVLESKEYNSLVIEDDIPNIKKLVLDIYTNPLSDSDYISDKLRKYIAYVKMKNLTESIDINDFNQYESYSEKISMILKESRDNTEEAPAFMVKDTIKRQFNRRDNPEVLPCPFKQLNELTNGGGYPKGSVLVFLDKAKARKTFTMINMARGYLKMRKSVLYIDTENGKDQIMGRMIQSTLNKSKIDLMSGEYDDIEKRHVRKYKKLGVEFVVDRAIALYHDCNYIKEKIHELRQSGIDIKVLVVDYAGKLASISKSKEDFERISDVYIDLQNLAFEEDLDIVISAHHVTREAAKHKETKYEESDISGSIAIIRNVQVVLGLNSTEEEESNNIQRMEVIVQRDGTPSGRAMFNIDVEKQRMTEFTKEQRSLYDKEYGDDLDSSLKKKQSNSNRPRKKQESDKNGDI